jgi:phage protein D
VRLFYDGVEISRDIAPFLISFSYIDNSGDELDSISVTLEDRKGNWRDPWFPEKGRLSAWTL